MARRTSLLVQEINRTMKVDDRDLNLPQYCFKQTIDPTLKSKESDPGRKVRKKWERNIGGVIHSVVLMSLSGDVHVIYTGRDGDWSEYTGCLNLNGEDNDGVLPTDLTDISGGHGVRVSADNSWCVMRYVNNESEVNIRTLMLRGDVWLKQQEYNMNNTEYYNLAISNNGQVVTRVKRDGGECLILYDERGERVWEEKMEYKPRDIVISPSGEVYVCDDDNYHIHTYSVTEGSHLAAINIDSPHDIAVSSTGRRLVVGHTSGGHHVISVMSPDGVYRRQLCQMSSGVYWLSLLGDQYLAVMCADNTIHLYDVSGRVQ